MEKHQARNRACDTRLRIRWKAVASLGGDALAARWLVRDAPRAVKSEDPIYWQGPPCSCSNSPRSNRKVRPP